MLKRRWNSAICSLIATTFLTRRPVVVHTLYAMSPEAAGEAKTPGAPDDGQVARGARKRKTVEFYKPPEEGKKAGLDSVVKEVNLSIIN